MPAPDLTPATPFRQALARLLRTARALAFLRRPTQTSAAASPLPPAPRPAFTLARTTEWLVALTRTLAGDRFFHHPVAYPRFPGRYPSLTAALRAEIGLPPVPPPTEAHRAAGRLHYMRRVFATQSTATIATRLARRLGLKPDSPAWPHALTAIATPPAQITLARRPGRKPRQTRALLPPIPKFTTPPIPTKIRVPQRE